MHATFLKLLIAVVVAVFILIDQLGYNCGPYDWAVVFAGTGVSRYVLIFKLHT